MRSNNSSELLSNGFFTLTKLALVPALAIVIGFYFRDFFYFVWFADDLTNYLAFKNGEWASTIGQSLFGGAFEKFRPIFQLAWYLIIGAFDHDIRAIFGVTVVVHAINAFIVFVIARKLTRGSIIVPVLCALAFSISRFGLYQVVQVTSLVESIALIFFLLMIDRVIDVLRSDQPGGAVHPMVLAIIFASCAFFTHERYLPCLLVLIALVFLPPIRDLKVSTRAYLFAAPIVAILTNSLYKTVVLHVPFFVGTGGTRIGIDITQVTKNAADAAASIVGFNVGDEYLVGVRIDQLQSLWPWLLAAALACGFLATLFIGLYQAIRSRNFAQVWTIAILALAAGVLLGPPVLTIRFEQRWGLAPYAVVLLATAWAIGASSGIARRVTVTIAAVSLCSALVLETFYRDGFKNIFFVMSAQIADIAARDLTSPKVPADTPIILIMEPSLCNWILHSGSFFKIYGGRARELECIADLTLPSKLYPAKGARAYQYFHPEAFREVGSEWYRLRQARALQD